MVLVMSAVVTSSLMLSPAFFSTVQDKILVQDARRKAEDEVYKLKSVLQYSNLCTGVLGQAVKFQGPNTMFHTPKQLFIALREKGSTNAGAPSATEISWGERNGEASLQVTRPLFIATKIYKANIHLTYFRIGPDNIPRIARTINVPAYLAFDAGNILQSCSLIQTSGLSTDLVSVEDRVCILQFGATTPDILYNPVTKLCQSASSI